MKFCIWYHNRQQKFVRGSIQWFSLKTTLWIKYTFHGHTAYRIFLLVKKRKILFIDAQLQIQIYTETHINCFPLGWKEVTSNTHWINLQFPKCQWPHISRKIDCRQNSAAQQPVANRAAAHNLRLLFYKSFIVSILWVCTWCIAIEFRYSAER